MGGAVSKGRRLSQEDRIKYIKTTPFYLYLQNDTLQEFAACFPYMILIKKGETPKLDESKLYIVATGELELTTTMADPKMKIENKGYLCKKRPGDILHKPKEQKLATEKLCPKTKKMETFVEQVETCATENSSLLGSDTTALNAFLTKYPELSLPFNANVSSYLEKIPFLQDLKASKLSVLATMCQYEAMDSDCTVFEENAVANKFYILLSGKATVLAPQWVGSSSLLQQSLEWGNYDDRSSSSIIVAGLKSGDYFGETSLFVNTNRTCTIRTTEKCLFISVGKKTFENFCAVCPQLKEKMREVMKQRMVSKLSSLGIPFLDGIPPSSMQLLTDQVEVQDYNEGEIIFSEGDVGNRFYIVVHGGVKVEKVERNEPLSVHDNLDHIGITRTDSTRNLGILKAGNYFGEMALVSDTPRSATVTSVDKTILLSVDKDSFRTIFANNPNSFSEFTLRLLQGSSELKHLLGHSLGMQTFRSFMKQNFAEENVDFWNSVNEFKNSKHDQEETRNRANNIFDTFCKEGAKYQVNLSYDMRSNIEKSLSEPSIHHNIFDESLNEIYKLMVRDNYARFKQTSEFFDFFKYLGILLEKE